MRKHLMLVLTAGLAFAACEDDPGPSGDGTLVVSTSTGGNDADRDGYVLTVDGHEAYSLDPTGTAEVVLQAGSHTLRLTGVAEQCTVTPGTPLEIDVPPRATLPVTFKFTCSATGIRITTATTGLDLDAGGYRIVADGIDRGVIPANGIVLTHLDPGSWTIALTFVASNCAIDGSVSRTVSLVEGEIVPIEFAVVCTATSGVIKIIIGPSDTDPEDLAGIYTATVDGGSNFFLEPSGPAYLGSVPAGDHVVSLVVPVNCSIETATRSVAVTAGGLTRDTVEVTFPVTCVPTRLRITAPTTGSLPNDADHPTAYIAVLSYSDFYYTYPTLLGALEPNGILMARAGPGNYFLELDQIPAQCTVLVPNPTPVFTLAPGDTLDIEFPVHCEP